MGKKRKKKVREDSPFGVEPGSGAQEASPWHGHSQQHKTPAVRSTGTMQEALQHVFPRLLVPHPTSLQIVPAAMRVQGMQLWQGVKRLALEIPIADQSPAAQLAIAQALIATFPSAAGLPIVVFGLGEVAEYARTVNVAFASFSVEEAALPSDDADDELSGPLLLFGTSYDQAQACQQIVEGMWRGRLVVVANAGWLRDTPPPEVEEFADTLDAVYFFLPVSFSVRSRQAGLATIAYNCLFSCASAQSASCLLSCARGQGRWAGGMGGTQREIPSARALIRAHRRSCC